MDYTQGKQYKNQKAADAAKADPLTRRDSSMWWVPMSKEDVRDGVRGKVFTDYCQRLKSGSEAREQANIRNARLYENVEVNSLSGPDYAASIVRQAILGAGVITLNVVQACIDTLAAKISKNKPRPDFQTSGGSWKSQMKARKLNRWMQGFFYETNSYEVGKAVFVDSEVFGLGAKHVYMNHDDKRLEVERVLPSELYVDDADGMYAAPRQLVRRKLVQREVLAAQFPEYTEAIMSSSQRLEGGQSIDGTTAALMVEVWEGWHLPSSKKAKDGKHIIAIQGCELFCEDWKVPVFPFVFLRSKSRVVGFWGKGTAESLMGIQLELNRLIRSISEQLRRKGRNQIFIQRGSKVNPAHLTNGIGDIIEHTGPAPTFNNQNVVSQEDYAQIDRLYSRGFQEVGVSQLSAAAKKPAGLDAGVALREYSDIESERFALKHQAWETMYMDEAKVAIALITEQYPELKEGYKVRLPSRRRAIEVDWKDINLDADSYVMQMYTSSSLPQTPAARKQFVKELEADGMISKVVAKRLLGFPDIEAEMDLGNAALDDVDATISAILDEEKPQLRPPEPYQNLALLLERTLANYLFVRHFEDIEPARLEMLRSLADMTSAMMAEQMQPPPMPGMAGPPGMAPPGLPPGAAPNISVTGPQVNMPASPVAPPVVQ